MINNFATGHALKRVQAMNLVLKIFPASVVRTGSHASVSAFFISSNKTSFFLLNLATCLTIKTITLN